MSTQQAVCPKTAVEIIEQLPWRFRVQGVIFLAGGLAYMFDAWDVLLTGFVMSLIRPVWNLSAIEVGTFGMVTFMGMGIGAVISGAMADTFGRKRVYVGTLLCFSVFSLACILAPSFSWLLAARFMTGLGLGGTVPVVYSMVAEFMPARLRGKALNTIDIFWGLGGICNGFIATVLAPYENWRLLFVPLTLPLLLAIWAIFYLSESPSFLAQKGRWSEASRIINQLITKTGAKVPGWTLMSTEPAQAHRGGIISRFKRLLQFDWKLTAQLWIVVMLLFLHRKGVEVWLPSILVDEDYSHQQAFLTTGILYPAGLAGILVSSWLIDIWGRRKVLIVSSVLSAIMIVAFTKLLGIPAYARGAIILYGFVGEATVATLYTFISESYPTHLRATGFGCASLVARFTMAFLVSLVFGGILLPTVGPSNAFIVVGILLVAGTFILHHLPETRGKALS
jgi:MFS transporter, putative metabolite:H+ symporter